MPAIIDTTKISALGCARPSAGIEPPGQKPVMPQPMPITKDNLDVVIDAGWIKKDEVCQGVKAGTVKVCG
jgi:D-xylose transport system substrate-binding protein